MNNYIYPWVKLTKSILQKEGNNLIGLEVKSYPSQTWVEYIREIDEKYIYTSTNDFPNMKTMISIKKLGTEFHELYYQDKNQILLDI